MPDRPSLRRGWATAPHPTRLAAHGRLRQVILARHAAAVERGLPTYVDPVSGMSVLTAAFLADRGDCCDSGCRHCPFVGAGNGG